MNRLVPLVALVGLVSAPALAGPVLAPPSGVQHAAYTVSRIEPGRTGNGPWMGESVWAATDRTGNIAPYAFCMDWGDIAGPQPIGGFSFAYGTNIRSPERFDAMITFFADYNGWCGAGVPPGGPTPLAGVFISNLPTAAPDGGSNAWRVTVDLERQGLEFTIDGNDLDGDGLVDFGYQFWFTNYVPNVPDPYLGPILAEWDVPTAPGADPYLDVFDENDCTTVDIAEQAYLELFDTNQPTYCPNPGEHGWHCTADIHPWPDHDCLVNLADLAQLLANYGCTACEHQDGDVEPEDGNGRWDPYDGDGDVDLADLAQLLAMYDNDCR